MFPSSKNIDGSNIDLTNYYTKTEVNAIVNSQGQAYIPCGTRMGYYGTTAPQGFLLCDGSEYLKTQYPQLSTLLAATDTAQSTTLFAGSDSDHFKVPDLRGEFVRGAGTNSHTGQGSGANVGVHQNATEIPNLLLSDSGLYAYTKGTGSVHSDKRDSDIGATLGTANGPTSVKATTWTNSEPKLYTSRPTNTSENMIIAYQDIYLAPRHQYSTEEQVVGKWIDGRNIYEKTIYVGNSGTITTVTTVSIAHGIVNMDYIVNFNGFLLYSASGQYLPVSFYNPSVPYQSFPIVDRTNVSVTLNLPSRNIYVTIQYTKTTDTIVNS